MTEMKISRNFMASAFHLRAVCLLLRSQNFIAMAVTRLKRKNRKDKAKSAVRRQTLKIQNFKPVIKNVDIEEIKKEFDAKKK